MDGVNWDCSVHNETLLRARSFLMIVKAHFAEVISTYDVCILGLLGQEVATPQKLGRG